MKVFIAVTAASLAVPLAGAPLTASAEPGAAAQPAPTMAPSFHGTVINPNAAGGSSGGTTTFHGTVINPNAGGDAVRERRADKREGGAPGAAETPGKGADIRQDNPAAPPK